MEGSHVNNIFRELGIYNVSVDIVLENGFEKAFGFHSNLKIWAEINVFPFNRNCLDNVEVKHKVVDLPDGKIYLEADPLSTKLLQIERLNKDSVRYLNSNGFDGNVFRKLAP